MSDSFLLSLVERVLCEEEDARLAVERAIGHEARSSAKQVFRRKRIVPGYPIRVPCPGPEEANVYLSQPKLTCLLCGKLYHMLPNHVRDTHGLTADEYRAAYRLPWTHGLAGADLAKEKSEGLKIRLADPAFASRWFADAEHYRELAHERAADQREQPFRNAVGRQRLQRAGRGPWDQEHYLRILDIMRNRDLVLKHVAGRLPGTPSYATAVRWFNSTPARKQLLVGTVHQLSPPNQAIARMLSPELVERVKTLRGQGLIYREIAATTGLDERMIGKLLHDTSGQLPPKFGLNGL